MFSLIELEVEPNPNSPHGDERSFMSRGETHFIESMTYVHDDGRREKVYVTGWENNQPVPARVVLVEDSGDGEAWLIFGGKDGLRFQPARSAKRPFSLDHPDEWGEPYLYYAKELGNLLEIGSGVFSPAQTKR